MAELKAGTWPITDTDFDAIDPHGEFIPRGPEADKETAANFRPWGLENRSDNTNVRKDYDPSDKFKTKDDEYMNKAPNEKMREARMREVGLHGVPEEDYIGDANEEIVDPRDTVSTVDSSRDVVDVEGESALPVYLQYDSAEDTEFSAGLDSFQHTHTQITREVDDDDGPLMEHATGRRARLLTERYNSEIHRLTEARGAKGELINQYLSQASSPDYDDFTDWALEQGSDDVPNKYYFNNLLKKRGGAGSGGFDAEEMIEREPFNPDDAPEELKQLMDLYAQSSDEDAQLEPTVDQKFKGIYAVGYRTAKGRALKRHAFICGSPGIGKTFTVVRAVEQGANEAKLMFAKFRGSIGKSLSAILAFLWMHRENYVVLLDDADGFLTGSTDEVMNTLKAAMDTDDPVISTGSPHIRKNVAKMVGMNESERWRGALNFDTSRLHENVVTAVDREGNVLVEEVLTAEERRFWEDFVNASDPKPETRSFLENSLYGRVQEGFFDEEGDEEEGDGNDLGLEDEIEEEEGQSMLPQQFLFDSRIIFVSNMMQSDIPEAIAGRCNVKELYLTRPEIMIRLEQIMPELLKNETAYSAEELIWAKSNVFRWMKAVIMAEDLGAPLALASGAAVKVSVKVPITFRMFNDFVDGWMQLSDEATLDATEANFDEIEEQIALQFISQVILPALRGDLRSKKKKR